MNAREIIDAARRKHPAFTEVRIPTVTLLPMLSDLQRTFVSKTVAIDEDAISTDVPVALPLADFNAGYDLPEFHRVRSVVAGTPDGGMVPLEVIPSAHRFARNRAAAAAWVIGGKLFLSGQASSWTAYNALAVGIVPVPGDFDTATDLSLQDSVLPSTARDALATGLAEFMAGRVGKTPDDVAPVSLSKFQNDATKALDLYLQDVRTRMGGQTFRIMDVFP